jgi:hypothetical protein
MAVGSFRQTRGLFGVCITWALFTTIAHGANPIQTENAKLGTSSWQLSNPATNHEIEGYASATSVNRGDQIDLFVNTASPSYTIAIYRMGWYAGLGGREVINAIARAGTQQNIPTPDPLTGLTECHWVDPYALTIPSDWTSGFYLVKLTATNTGKQSYIIFVVRDDSSLADYLFQSSVTTYQAYNNWGGKALYFDRSTNGIPAVKVSFDRPYNLGPNSSSAPGVGAGEFIANLQPSYETACAGYEYNMVRFLEREGYDVTYCTDVDTHANGSGLLTHKGFLSVGHDEYWSWEMRANVEAARDTGVSIGFFGANACYWQIRFEPDANGTPNRTIVAYKGQASVLDPYATDGNPSNDYLITGRWRQNSVKPPEDAFIGVMYQTDPVNGDLVIEDASNWVCAGTGLVDGDSLPGLVGYEIDRMYFNAPPGTARIGHSVYTFNGETSVFSDLTVYTANSGATVFATGSMQWNWGLDDYNSPALRPVLSNSAAQQMTRNVLASFVEARPAGSSPAITVLFADDFNDNLMDVNKWTTGAIEATLGVGPTAWDPSVTVIEQNQRLEIAPSASVLGSHYNGYVSVPALDLTNAAASVEVIQTADGNADTYLAVCIDGQNHYKIQKEGGSLYFAQVVAGVTTGPFISYSPVDHRFWRIRHIQPTHSIVFETSPDGEVWTMQWSVPQKLSVDALRLEIGAGTNEPENAPGTAIFDNFQVAAKPTDTLPIPLPSPTATIAPILTPKPAPQFLNISTRMLVGTDDNVLIAGFIITGSEQKTVILRAIGPSLSTSGVEGVLPDPTLELHDATGAIIASNDNWRDTQQSEIEASGLQPEDDRESATIQTLDPGAYTAIIRGNDGSTGVALAEVYDISQSAQAALANISTRGFVGSGNNIMIGGFIIGGSDAIPSEIIARAIGPSLTDAGISNPLNDPVIELHDDNGTLLMRNDNWRDTQQADIAASGLAPNNDAESAIIAFLIPGAYTITVSGNSDATGVALMEVYNMK